MHWEIEVIIRVEDVEIDYINEGLLLHHSITDIENPSSIWIKERKENGKIVEENLLDNQYNYRIEFKAIVFSTEEQESLRRYITRMNGVDSKKMLFKTLTGKEKASKAISVASISAIIVFIIIFINSRLRLTAEALLLTPKAFLRFSTNCSSSGLKSILTDINSLFSDI